MISAYSCIRQSGDRIPCAFNKLFVLELTSHTAQGVLRTSDPMFWPLAFSLIKRAPCNASCLT